MNRQKNRLWNSISLKIRIIRNNERQKIFFCCIGNRANGNPCPPSAKKTADKLEENPHFGIIGGKETIVVLEVDLAGMYPALRDSQNDITVNCTSFASCSRFGSSANGNRTRI